MKGLLLDVDYAEEEAQPRIRLFLKSGAGIVVAIDPTFEQYLYATASNAEKAAKLISKLELTERGQTIKPKSVAIVKRTFLGREVEVVKVAFHHPKDMPPLRHAMRELPGIKEIYEFDIPSARRYLVDRGLTPMSGVSVSGKVREENGIKTLLLDGPPKPVDMPEQKLNVMSFDIEVYNPAGTPRPDKDPILMISLADNRGFKKVITWKDLKVKLDYVKVVESEREMLKRFVELVEERDVDILLGYNTDLFDFPYLRERAKQLRVKLKLGRDGSEVIARKRRFATATRIRGRVHIDVYTMVNFLATIGTIRLIHYTLEDVYRHMLGREKPDFKFTEMAEAWEQGGERAKELLEYCMSDSQATLELGLELLPLFFELTRIIRQTPFDVTRMTPGQLVEWLLIADARKVGELVPARPVGEEYAERLEETYVGAYVMEPAKGLHEDLIVFDFRSLYPSIIVSHNIDPSTLNCKCCKPSEATTVPELDYRFCGRRKGFISSTLERLIEARAKLKRELKQHKRGTKEYRSLDSQQWALKIVANSVDGNEPVVLRDPSGRIQIKNIGSFVDKFITEACTQHVGNTEVADPPAKWEALSFNGTNMMFTPIKKVIRHPAPETLYEVKLSSGKKVRVTADHSVFVLDQDLNAMPIETRALKPGDYILAPRKVPTKPYAQDTLNLIQEFSKLAPELLEDICIYVDRRPRRGVIETRIRILELLSDRKPRHISQIGEKIGRGSRCISKNAASLIREGYLREVRRRRNLRIVEITEKGSRRLQIEKTLLEHLKYDGSKRRHFIFINNLKPIVGLLNDEEIRTWSVGVYRHGRKFSPIIKITPEFFRLLGYFISEGSGYIAQNPRGGRSYSISIANEDEEIRRDIINCIKTTFGGEPYVWRKGIMITQKVPYLALSAVLNMDLKAGEKRIPELVLNSPTEHQLAFLHAYWRGDGSYRESTGQYVFTTKSGKLITDLSFLLSQLGVCVTLVEDSGVHRAIVNEDLPFKPSTAINRRSYSHVVPGKLMIPLLKGMRKVKKYPHVLQGKNMRIEKALELVNEFLKTNPGDEYANRLLKFLTGDLLLEKIIEINAVKPSTEYVYDLSVEGNENFVGGHGLVCLHNSFYGMLGYPRARWYFKECAESVTSFGRHYIRKTIDMARDFDFDVIYSDTDSLYCKLNGKKREDAMKFLKQVNESLPGIMELEFEGFYPRGIFVTKKRYAMIDEEGRMVVKGLEFVRRDWAALAKKTQEAALEAILRDGSPKKAAEIVRRTTRDVLEGKVSLNDLVIYTQLKMPIESYRSIGPHVVAAKRLRELGREVEPGMMIAYIEAKGPGSISERAVPVEDFKGREYDPDYYVEHQVLPAVMRIMEVLGYREEDLRYEREKQMDLEKFMR